MTATCKEKYESLYKLENGKMRNQYLSYKAAGGVFDVLAYKNRDGDLRAELKKCIDDLKYFGYTEFTQGQLLENMKREVENVIQKVLELDVDSFWEDDELSKQFEKQHNSYRQRQQKRRQQDGVGEEEDGEENDAEDNDEEVDPSTRKRMRDYQKPWIEVPAETARRIAYWWGHHVDDFPYFSEAAKLVFATPVHSCDCERVFNVLKAVHNRCGSATSESVTTGRTRAIYNKGRVPEFGDF
mmetsp:Transcript_10211/g.18484  ORF Transcript_10211/g.18484 Transcript_10211/m.18484 type:complete len:241 (+) Transcript_10211:545-1267(+)